MRIRLAAQLHDIGKTAIPASILDKPGPLDEREWEFMRRHPLIGERIVLAAPALADTAPLIRSSHERIDGQGYPDGLAGDDIPIGSRIIAVCDAFDAMTSRPPLPAAIRRNAALEELDATPAPNSTRTSSKRSASKTCRERLQLQKQRRSRLQQMSIHVYRRT